MNYLGYGILGISVLYIGKAIYNRGKNYLYSYIFEQVKKELDERLNSKNSKNQIEKDDMCKPFHNNSMKIQIDSDSIYVPYNEEKIYKMRIRKVYLIKNGEKIDISQKPGIPYLVSASSLGGEQIVVEDLSGDVIHTFSKDEIPHF
jgi:hypothetical protein